MTTETATYLKYANVQMAAEAMYTDKAASPGQTFSGSIGAGMLVSGNERASKFIISQADEFSLDWTIVEHISNTTTGFSGTLFRALRTDAKRGLSQGELVLSFRSTEFADDAVRDTQATSNLEIREKGWAFGQIDDMERWYESLLGRDMILGGRGLTVTGYSLGGHLATAFDLLHPDTTAASYTFNGAGVGIVKTDASLAQVIDEFHARRTRGNADLFTDQIAAALYHEFRGPLTPGNTVSRSQVQAALTTLASALGTAAQQPTATRYQQVLILHEAMSRIDKIIAEADRINAGISSGTETPGAQRASTEATEALGLDYQLAVVKASGSTAATRAIWDKGMLVAYGGRRIAQNRAPGLTDVFAGTSPSGVANSQIHYGNATPIWIEDQPLMRGEAISGIREASGLGVLAFDFKLLMPSFGLNDVGDTHSLVLLIDSLAVQNAFALLAPSLAAAEIKSILTAASNSRMETGYISTIGTNNQGKADGDSLDNLVNALGAYLGVDAVAGWVKLKGNPNGGSWTDIEKKGGFTGRRALHTNLGLIASDPDYVELLGKVTLEATSAAVAESGKSDFADLVALHTLSPFVLKAPKGSDGEAALNELWSGVWGEEFEAWQTDRAARDAGQPAVNFTDSWFSDRASMLVGLMRRNTLDMEVGSGLRNIDYVDAASETTFTQRVAGAGINAPASKVWFGGEGSETIAGTNNLLGDRLYGGGGDDTLDGKGGNDYFEGGIGADTYRFDDAFGKDTVTDSDGNGSILIDTKELGEFKGAGKRGGYAFDMGGGQYAGLAVIDSGSSTTGYKAVILKGTDSSNTITVNNFDPDKALDEGYLGIKLDAVPDVALVRGGGPNYWRDLDASADALEGKSAAFSKGGAVNFMISLSLSALPGATLVLRLGGLAGKGVKAILGDDTVDADGAVITLAEGQTQVSFALVQDGDLDGDVEGSLSVAYQADDISAISNTWSLNLEDTGETDNTITGDILARAETNDHTPIYRTGQDGALVIVVDPRKPYFVRDDQNNLVAGTTDPTLIPRYNAANELVGYLEIPSDDVTVTDNTLYGTSGNDRIDGKTGNDLLAGNAGNDQIDGGTGNDMIGGGAGDDHIEGGEGDDFISSSADIQPYRQLLGPDDNWAIWGKPANADLQASGTMWGVYPDAADTSASVWDAMAATRTDTQSDSIDAGDGDDWVMASWGDDRIQGGAGDDRLEGLAGDDVLEGGEGDDKLDGDGILMAGYQNSVGADRHGSDFIDGGAGKDEIRGGGGSDNIFGGAGNDTIFADGSGASDSQTFVELQYQGEDYIDGEDGDDYAEGGGKDDTLYGGSGKDTLWGDTAAANLKDAAATDPMAWGDDYLDGEDGDDLLYGGGGDDMLYGGKGKDQLLGDDGPALAGSMHGTDYLDGEDDDDTLVGGGKDDTLFGGAGNDTLHGDADFLDGEFHGNDYLDGQEGDDVLIGHGGADQLFGGAGDDELQGDGPSVAAEYQGADSLDGGDGDDRLFGGGGDDTLVGGVGADQMSGDDGNDSLSGGDGADVLVGGSGDDIVQGGKGDDTIDGGSGNDQIAGGAGDDDLNSGDGDDLLDGGAGDDRYGILGTQGTKTLIDEGGTETLDLGWRLDDTELGRGSLLLRNTATGQRVHIEGFDADDATSVSAIERFVFSADDGTALVLSAAQMIQQLGFAGNGTARDDVLSGTAFRNLLNGGAGDDLLVGNEGDDRLDGGSGANQLLGGMGDDVYVVAAQGQDEIIEFDDEGQDTVEASVDYVLTAANVETVLLTGGQAIDATGGDGDDRLVGNAAVNVLDGGAGADLLEGRGGDDTYRVDNIGDRVVEQAGQGTDTVIASVSYELADNVENLVLVEGAETATGNSANNRLQGNDEDNRLRGMGGNDRMEGGAGSDTYVVRNDRGVKTIADTGGEHDILDLGWNVYATHFVLGSSPNNLGLYNAATGQLIEIEGIDPLALDAVSPIESVMLFVPIFDGYEADFSIDAAFRTLGLSFFGTSSADTLTGTWRRDRLYGFQGSDTLIGAAGDDNLDGGAGGDRMAGGAGDDVYIVDDPADTVVELVGEGYDSVLAASDFSLQGTDVEYLEMTDADHHTGTGSDSYNYMLASAGGSSLFGEGGNDEVVGRLGDDSLHGGAGNDLIQAHAGDDLLAGDDGDDELRGDEGNDVLEGGVGRDVLFGNAGSDRLDGGSDDDTLSGGEGIDVLLGGAGNDTLDGGDGQDQLMGGDGDDTLLNSAGGDILAGGVGDDIYREDTIHGEIAGFANSGTEIVENPGGGTDTVMVYESFTLGDNLENLTLFHRANAIPLVGIGNAEDNRIENRGVGDAQLFGLQGDDVLVGGTGVNWLDGGRGADLMVGGIGSTDFFVDEAGDQVVALSNGGDETVHSSLDYALVEFVENLILEEGSATIGTGNDLFNHIIGNANDNILDGGAGSDSIHGGGGNDVLIGIKGHDDLHGDDGDDLLLGSDLGTVMFGGAGRDQLFGGAGSDQLVGGADADLMVGYAGDDRYVVDDVQDVVVEEVGGGTDSVLSLIDYTLPDTFENLTVAGYGLTGIGNAQDNVIRGDSGGESLFGLDGDDLLDAGTGTGGRLDGGAGSDTLVSAMGSVTLVGGGGDDIYRLVSGGTLVELPGGGYDRVILDAAQFGTLTLVLENVEELDATSSEADLHVWAGDDDNLILGSAGRDVVDAGGGDDRIFGGNGKNATMYERGGITGALEALLNNGLPAPRTFERLLADFSFYISQDSSAINWPSPLNAWRIPASPDGVPEQVPLFISDYYGQPREQALFIQPDGSLAWEGEGFWNDSLSNWQPRTGSMGWDELQAEFGLRSAVPAAERNAYLAISGNLIPVPDRAEGDIGHMYTMYWPRDRLPAEMPALISDLLESDEGHNELARAMARSGEDRLHGGEGDDVLDGGDGNDALFGGAGNDTLIGGADNDAVIVSVYDSFEGGLFGVELGAAAANNDDILDGGAGLDLLIGGTGSDTYYVDGVSTANTEGHVTGFDWCDVKRRFGMDGVALDTWVTDSVVEQAGQGDDTVIASASVVLAHIETVVLSDRAPNLDIDARTDAGAQTLLGNAGRNTLDGGAGADYMAGGYGDDTYIVDDAGDVVVEQVDGHQDIVRTTLDHYVLPENIEALLLDGAANLSASGNAASNVLIGNIGDNVIEGGAGDDMLAGWRGDDVLRGGEGFDYYVFARGDGHDSVEDADGGELHFSGSIRNEHLAFRLADGGLQITVEASGEEGGVEVLVRDWLSGNAGSISQISFCTDGRIVTLDEFVLMRPQRDALVLQDNSTSITANILDNDAASFPRDRLTMNGSFWWEGQFGSATADENGSFEYTLNTDSFGYHALAQGQVGTDALGAYDAYDVTSGRWLGSAGISVDVVGVNDAPFADWDTAWATEDWELVVAGNVLENDSDIDQDEIAVRDPGTYLGGYGFLRIDAAGNYNYFLDNDAQAVQALGADQPVSELFQYVAVDSHGAESIGVLEVVVYGDNDAPIGSDDAVTCLEDGADVTGNVLANDTDIDSGDFLSVLDSGLFTGSYGTLRIAENGDFSYAIDNANAAIQALASDQRTSDHFTYTLFDSYGQVAQSELDVEIVGVNDGPIALADAATATEDGPAVSGNVLGNDSDPDAGDTLGVANAGTVAGQYGRLTLASGGGYSYALDNSRASVQALGAGQHASEAFAYAISDGHGGTAASQLMIDIAGANDGPVAHADTAAVSEDAVLSAAGNLLANDSDADADDTLSVSDAGSKAGQYGTLMIDSRGSYTYNLANGSTAVQALAAGQKVSDVFAYTVADSHGATATAQLTVEITGAADSAGVTLVGTSRDDMLVGTAYADVINGGKGSDTMAGGKGDDIYFVDAATAQCDEEYEDHDDDRDHDDDDRDHGDDDNSDCNCETGDSVVELAGAGIDTVAASVNYVLPQNVENLMLLGSAALVGTGNNLANVMVASGGPSILSGAGGNDVLVGRSASDTLLGGSGDDKLYGEAGNDRLDGGQGADRAWGGAGNDVLDGGDGDNLLAGGTGDDTMVSGSGSDVVVAGAGNDKVTAGSGNDFIDAGAGSDTIDGGSGSDFIAAGRGSDTVTSGAGRDVIAFNRGDGQDILLATSGSGSADVLSLGGGICYADLTLNRRGSDLVLGVGAADQITSKNWYASQDNKSISTLQVVTVGGDYNAASTNTLLGNKVVAFDFTTITQQYDAARKANASLGIWSLQPALNSAVIGASNTSAIGGDLAFDYATTYSTSGGYGPDMTAEVVRKEVKEQTGTTRQAIDTAPAPAAGPTLVDPWVALQAGTDLVVSKAPGASNPVTPTNSPTTDSLVLAAMAAGTDVQPPTWAVK